MADTCFFACGGAEAKLMRERQESDASTQLPTFGRERCVSGFSVDSDFAYEKHEEQEQILLADFNIGCEVKELEKLPGTFDLMEPLVSQATAKHQTRTSSAGRGSDLLPVVAVLSVTVLGASYYPAMRYSVITTLAAIALPGIYLWIADGCRPEDLNTTRATWMAGPLAISIFLGCPYFLGMSFSSLVLCCMMGAASVMLLPGIYLWTVDGCRPEDFQESTSKWPIGALGFLLCLSCQYSLDMSCYSLLSCCVTCIAALMVLPGIYLWVVDGCRPEDFPESCSAWPVDVLRAVCCLSSLYFLCACISSAVSFCMLCVAAVLVLPGIYLWMVDGCRPEDFQESVGSWSATPILAMIPLLCCMSSSSSATYCMAGIAALILLPGIQLWTVDGCRPEFFEEASSPRPASFLGPMLFLATPCFLGMSVLSVVMYTLTGVAALMLLPGIYLWIVDGCRPEDYQGFAGTWPVGGIGVLLLFCCLYFSGMSIPSAVGCCMLGAAVLVVLPGIYLWTVDGCRPEDFQESGSNLPTRALGMLPLLCFAYFQGMSLLSGLGYFVTGVAALMLLPGAYLWVIDGCRPDDFQESAGIWRVGFLVAAVSLICVSFAGISWYSLAGLTATGMAALMLLPGINLWMVEGCRPEDF